MFVPRHLDPADIARRELRLFLSMADQTGMDEDWAHRSLLVSQMTGADGSAFCTTRHCRRVLNCRCCCVASAT